jgi:hypothetical protein
MGKSVMRGMVEPGIGVIYPLARTGGKQAYVWSRNDVWMPGAFATIKALKMAFIKLTPSGIQELQDKVSPFDITEEDVFNS